MVMVSGGFQCVNHVAPSTTLEEGSIALDVLRHSPRHNAVLLRGGPSYTPRKLRSQDHRSASRFDHRMDPVTTVVDLRMDGTQCRAITCRV